MNSSDNRTERWIGLSIAIGLFVIYALGACRTIYVGDSGELVTAVYVLGIPHPSGYPLYALLGKIWTLVVPIVAHVVFNLIGFLLIRSGAAGVG